MTAADVPPMSERFRRLVEGCAYAWTHDFDSYGETIDALWRWHREEVAKAEAAAVAPFAALAREVCHEANTCEEYPAPFVCQNDDGDAIIVADTPLDALRGMLWCWERCQEQLMGEPPMAPPKGAPDA